MAVLARIAPALALLCLAGACTTARPVPATSRPVVSEVVRRQLGNGARVVIQEHRASAVAALQLWVSAGGRDEAPTELGLAHYLEHMLFKGTPSRPSGFIEREVEGVGGRMNAGTSLDYTYYHTVLPARRAVAGLELLADIASNASLDEGTLEREKLVVLEEMRRSEDNPRRHLMRHLYALALEGHPYSRPVIGTPELITPLARETLVAYYRRHYVPKPSRSSWWVTSTATPSLLLPVARSVACRAAAPVALPFPPHRRRKRDDWRCHAPIATPTRGSRGSLPPSIMPIWQPSIFLVAVLGDSRTSRLTQTLRDRLGASSPASAAPTPRSKARAR